MQLNYHRWHVPHIYKMPKFFAIATYIRYKTIVLTKNHYIFNALHQTKEEKNSSCA